MNKEFMGFIYRYAHTVSHSKKSIDDEIKENPGNLMTLLTPSDVAWALLVYVNNDEYWTWKIKYKNKKKMVENAEGSESDSDCGDGEEGTRGDHPTEEGGKGKKGKKLQQSGSMGRRVVQEKVLSVRKKRTRRERRRLHKTIMKLRWLRKFDRDGLDEKRMKAEIMDLMRGGLCSIGEC